ncbi:hypothetical protein PRK78_005693 [Emydomyces testavorans]|uniref:non-specific serine/threonine protein kinase n=1 Tax=Emydomyces testavorans TaxID=2070801 RepID=A0AAF0IKA6_9EURO|nr:hypothetical protein PRK78_005693 [Emydomyces testavorans]
MSSFLARLGLWPFVSRYLPQRASQLPRAPILAPSFTSPLTIPTTGFEEINISQKIEEEQLPTYKQDKYYPAEIGQILKDKYQIVGKLGYGGSSTVWLSRDLEKCQHVVLKLFVNDSQKGNNVIPTQLAWI